VVTMQTAPGPARRPPAAKLAAAVQRRLPSLPHPQRLARVRTPRRPRADRPPRPAGVARRRLQAEPTRGPPGNSLDLDARTGP